MADDDADARDALNDAEPVMVATADGGVRPAQRRHAPELGGQPTLPGSTSFLVHQLRAQFGERVAFYFAFQDKLTRWMMPLGVVGAIITALQLIDPRLYHAVSAVWGIFIACAWATLFLRFWN